MYITKLFIGYFLIALSLSLIFVFCLSVRGYVFDHNVYPVLFNRAYNILHFSVSVFVREISKRRLKYFFWNNSSNWDETVKIFSYIFVEKSNAILFQSSKIFQKFMGPIQMYISWVFRRKPTFRFSFEYFNSPGWYIIYCI